jgi:2,5-dihydroxypyridine 5,6-dioxygenase
MWSTGSNRFAQRETPAHLDIPMRGCSVFIDDRAIVIDGQLQNMTELVA